MSNYQLAAEESDEVLASPETVALSLEFRGVSK